jgi:hypothetical protein
MWYYCDNPQGYYRYVSHGPGGWWQVPATSHIGRPARSSGRDRDLTADLL